MATRTIRTERQQRGIFGWLFLILFWGFNALMAYGFFSGLAAVSDDAAALKTDAERAGAAIGTMLGAGMIMTFWLIGALILGLLVWMTRGAKVIVETTE